MASRSPCRCCWAALTACRWFPSSSTASPCRSAPAGGVLFIGSGGLSHDPPVAFLTGAAPEIAAQLIFEGRHLTPEQRAARQMRVIQAGREYAAGVSMMRPLNPEWDKNLLAVLASGDLEQVDSWSTGWFTEQAGGSAHETRTSIAAYAALAATGPYQVTASFYEP